MDKRQKTLRQNRSLLVQLGIIAIFALTGGACTTAPELKEPDTPISTHVSILTETPSQTPIINASALPSETPQLITDICSPLFDHELARISEYMSNPFAAPVGSNLETGHHGTDFSYYRKDGDGPPINGTPIQSVLSGRVVGVGFDRLPYGNMLIIETPYEQLPLGVNALYELESGMSLYLLYAHMLESPSLALGDEVSCGQVIGWVGGTGFSGNPHLHLETRVGNSGQTLSTMAFYDTTATLDEQDEYREWRTSERFSLFDPMLLLSYVEQP